jgi:hypothetical protein
MLQQHALAVEHGFIWIENISEADAKSLRDRMYRIRRRSDKSMAAFIPPEYHLVMIGKWEQSGDDPSLGRMPLIYNKRADGRDLPTTRIPSGEEAATYTPPTQLAEPAPIVDTGALDLSIKPEEIGGYVQTLRARRREREGGE